MGCSQKSFVKKSSPDSLLLVEIMQMY